MLENQIAAYKSDHGEIEAGIKHAVEMLGKLTNESIGKTSSQLPPQSISSTDESDKESITSVDEASLENDTEDIDNDEELSFEDSDFTEDETLSIDDLDSTEDVVADIEDADFDIELEESADSEIDSEDDFEIEEKQDKGFFEKDSLFEEELFDDEVSAEETMFDNFDDVEKDATSRIPTSPSEQEEEDLGIF